MHGNLCVHESHSFSDPGQMTVLTEKRHAECSARNYSLKRIYYTIASGKIKGAIFNIFNFLIISLGAPKPAPFSPFFPPLSGKYGYFPSDGF